MENMKNKRTLTVLGIGIIILMLILGFSVKVQDKQAIKDLAMYEICVDIYNSYKVVNEKIAGIDGNIYDNLEEIIDIMESIHEEIINPTHQITSYPVSQKNIKNTIAILTGNEFTTFESAYNKFKSTEFQNKQNTILEELLTGLSEIKKMNAFCTPDLAKALANVDIAVAESELSRLYRNYDILFDLKSSNSIIINKLQTSINEEKHLELKENAKPKPIIKYIFNIEWWIYMINLELFVEN